MIWRFNVPFEASYGVYEGLGVKFCSCVGLTTSNWDRQAPSLKGSSFTQGAALSYSHSQQYLTFLCAILPLYRYFGTCS